MQPRRSCSIDADVRSAGHAAAAWERYRVDYGQAPSLLTADRLLARAHHLLRELAELTLASNTAPTACVPSP